MSHVVIVGAGISGLATAYHLGRLTQAEVTVLEQRDRPGGTVWTECRDGFRVESGPNGFLDSKPSTLTLCRDLSLGDCLVSASEASARNRYLFLGGRLRRLPSGLADFFTSDLLSWRGKLNLLAERFRPRRRAPTDESIDAFVRRRAGPEAALLVDALVTGIHAGDPALLSVRAAFPRLAALEEQYGSVLKGMAAAARQRRAAKARGEPGERTGKLWTCRDGLRALIEALRDCLPQPPLLGVTVRRLERLDSGSWSVRGAGQDHWQADAVVLACPAYQQAALLADLDPALAERIGGIAYNRIAVIALGYHAANAPKARDGFGYIAPQRLRRDVLGVQWCSSIFPGHAPDGMVLLRVMAGGWHRPEVVGWDDDRLVSAVRAELRLAMGITAPPRFVHLVRWDRAIPQYRLGHLERVRWIEQRVGAHPGLFLTGNAYHGVALNDCTEQAALVAERVARYLAPHAVP